MKIEVDLLFQEEALAASLSALPPWPRKKSSGLHDFHIVSARQSLEEAALTAEHDSRHMLLAQALHSLSTPLRRGRGFVKGYAHLCGSLCFFHLGDQACHLEMLGRLVGLTDQGDERLRALQAEVQSFLLRPRPRQGRYLV